MHYNSIFQQLFNFISRHRFEKSVKTYPVTVIADISPHGGRPEARMPQDRRELFRGSAEKVCVFPGWVILDCRRFPALKLPRNSDQRVRSPRAAQTAREKDVGRDLTAAESVNSRRPDIPHASCCGKVFSNTSQTKAHIGDTLDL